MRMAVRSLRLSIVLAVVLAGCTTSATRVPLPSEPAAPRTILLAYLDALVAGACASARALAAPGLNGFGGGIWCDRPRVIDYRAPFPSDQPGGDPSSQLVYAVEINVMGGDQSLPDGWRVWFFLLEPQPGGMWRVTSTGSGP